MYGDKGDCPDCDPKVPCPKPIVGIASNSCLEYAGIKPSDELSAAVSKLACKIVSLNSKIEQQTSLIDTLTGVVNNFKNGCCSVTKTYTQLCSHGQTLKIEEFKVSIDGGFTYNPVLSPTPPLVSMEETTLSLPKMKALGFDVYLNDSKVHIVWTETDALKYKLSVSCQGEIVVDEQKFNAFFVPVCNAGYKPFVTVFKIDGVPQIFDGEWNDSFKDYLTSLGWKNSSGFWYINSDKQYEIALVCVAKTATLQNFSADCEPGCEFKIPVAGLKRNGLPMNNVAYTYPTLAEMLLYLRSVDVLWNLTGSTFSITSPDTWSLSVECVNCTVPNGTCEICATYNGGSPGAALDLYYTLNGGPVQLVSLEPGDCFNTASSNEVKIISRYPQNSLIQDWLVSYSTCDLAPEDEASLSPTVAIFKEGEEACNGTLRGQLEAMGMGINSTNDGLLPGNSIVVKVDGVTQINGAEYNLTYAAGVVTIDALSPWTGLGGGLLSTTPGGSCPGGYANDNIHTVEIVITNGVGSTASFTISMVF